MGKKFKLLPCEWIPVACDSSNKHDGKHLSDRMLANKGAFTQVLILDIEVADECSKKPLSIDPSVDASNKLILLYLTAKAPHNKKGTSSKRW